MYLLSTLTGPGWIHLTSAITCCCVLGPASVHYLRRRRLGAVGDVATLMSGEEGRALETCLLVVALTTVFSSTIDSRPGFEGGRRARAAPGRKVEG
jgi:hypothetical protein